MPLNAPTRPCAWLEALFRLGVDAAHPRRVMPDAHDHPLSTGRVRVVGAGKAAAAMARVLEDSWPADRPPPTGLVVTRYGHSVDLDAIECVEAAHPMPDQRGFEAAGRLLQLAEDLRAGDHLIVLMSGGGSALLTRPAPGLSLADKQAVSSALLRSGAGIAGINTVRKHLSAIKGGRLALAAWPASVTGLMISDVPGDDPATIASGPTVADATTLADARGVLERYGITPSAAIRRHLESPAAETPKPGDRRLAAVENRVIARSRTALEAMAAAARQAGVEPCILGDAIEGESREVARDMATTVRAVLARHHPVAPPCVLLSGGETSVTMRGNGRGGRNLEWLLAIAIALDGLDGVYALAGDSDGIDGTEAVAGACVTPGTLARARAADIDPQRRLEDNDGYGFFEALGDCVVTGPTCTNVNDLRAILILDERRPSVA